MSGLINTPEILAEFERLKQIAMTQLARGITVGLHDDSGSDSRGVSNAQKGIWNEFGTEHIPERSFLRATIFANVENYERLMGNMINDVVYERITADEAYTALGNRVVIDVKKAVTDFSSPANAASTIAAKGFDNPLIETGAMRDAIAFKRVE